jgi:hypothetical protein
MLFPVQNALAEPVDLQMEINRLIKIVEEQGKQIKVQQKDIKELQSQERTATSNTQSKSTAQNAANDKKTTALEKKNNPPSSQETKTQPVGQAPKEFEQKNIPDIASLFAQPGVLTPKGKLIIEPSLQYSNSSNNRIALFGYTIIPAITIGLIDVRSVTSDTFVASINSRYGVTNRLEFELRVPYVYRQDTSITRPYATPAEDDEVFTLSDHGLGDIEFGLRYQLNQPISGPYYLAGLRVKTDTGQGPFDVATAAAPQLRTELPTGSGSWGIQPSLTLIYPSDPAVFYGSIDYMWTIEDNVGGAVGKYDPGDIYGFNVGIGLALNDKASISFGYDHSIIGRARQNGNIPQGASTTHVGSFFVGGSHKLTEDTTFNLSVGLGATEFAPDVQITTSVAVGF